MNDRRVYDAILRTDLTAFTNRALTTVVPASCYLPNWHLRAIAHHLELCRKREIRRLIITIPPRSLKSITASVAFPAFALGHDPSLRIICVSYAQDLTEKHARDCRSVMESDWYRRAFPRTRIGKGKNTVGEFDTTAHGYRLGTSVGGTLTGRGGNMIIIDDPIKPADAMSEAGRAAVNEWFDGTLMTRLDNKTEDVIILIMQRLHIDDLVGHVLAKNDGWVQLNLPAIADTVQEIPFGGGRVHRREIGDLLHPARESREVLDGLKASMGSQRFLAQYQQTPVPPEGALIKWKWISHYKTVPDRGSLDQIVQSWDTASKAGDANDYSVCTTWLLREKNYYLLDVLRQRLEYPDLRRKIIAHAEKHDASALLIEDAGSGMHLIPDLKREGKLRPIGIKPEKDKVVRMEAETAIIEAGYVHLPESAAWLDDFKTEIMAFPYGRHDDQVDSLSQFLAWAKTRRPRIVPTVVGIPKRENDRFSS